ncbi:MAG: hypothetical protein K2N58_09595 [Treponemataceae bacterium]|nr:hypothetical protein [Treponemataceae bacterium]
MNALKKIAFFLTTFLYAENIFSQSRPVANKISAIAGAEKNIEIAWTFPERTTSKITGAKIYRAAKPISSYQEIAHISPIAHVAGSQYIDTVSKGGEYFYAVIAVTEKGDYKAIIPGLNSTTSGARPRISAKEERAQSENEFEENPPSASNEKSNFPQNANSNSMQKFSAANQEQAAPPLRKTPLPFPGTILGLENERKEFSEEAKQSVANLANGSKKQKSEPFKTPYFFEDDMFAPDGGDGYILFETLREGLVQRKYRESVGLFIDFLSVNRNAAVTNRAEFYLGESFYFCGEYKKAVQCFLAVQEIFPALAKKWIDSSLDLMESEF